MRCASRRGNDVNAARLAVGALSSRDHFRLAHVNAVGGHTALGQHIAHGLRAVLGQLFVGGGIAGRVDEAGQHHLGAAVLLQVVDGRCCSGLGLVVQITLTCGAAPTGSVEYAWRQQDGQDVADEWPISTGAIRDAWSAQSLFDPAGRPLVRAALAYQLPL